MHVLEVLNERKLMDSIPVLVISGDTSYEAEKKCFELGITDYITKPFNSLELVARVKAQLRRAEKYNKELDLGPVVEEYFIHGLYVNADNHVCTLYERELGITPIEFEIVLYLCRHMNQVVGSEELFEAVWKEKYFEANNTVFGHIARIREKMGENSRKPRFIKTVWGVGYKLESEAWGNE